MNIRGTAVVVAGWVGSTNLGDELLFRALSRKLASRGVTPVALSVAPEATARAHDVAAVGTTRLLSAIGGARAMVLGGGGLLQDETSPFNLPWHLSRAWLAGARHTPWAGVGLGAGRLDTRAGRFLVGQTMRRAGAVSVRDEASAAVLRPLGVDPVVAADLALSLPSPTAAPADRLVACLRPWAGRRSRLPVAVGAVGAGGRRRTASPDWFLAGMAAALDEAAAHTGLAVHLVSFQADRDHAVHLEVADRMRTPVTTACPGLDDVVAEVASGRVVVAQRYHAGIAAVLGGRPSVLVGYSPKVTSLAADVGAGAEALPWAPEALTGLADAVSRVVDRADDVTGALHRLRRREQGNDAVLDRLLEATT